MGERLAITATYKGVKRKGYEKDQRFIPNNTGDHTELNAGD